MTRFFGDCEVIVRFRKSYNLTHFHYTKSQTKPNCVLHNTIHNTAVLIVMKISLKQGTLQGVKKVSRSSGKPFYSFLGIPYAKPPIDLLRFKAPQPHEGWTGILNATENKTLCPQIDKLVKNSIVGNEDCLYLNIHIPEDPHSIKVPKPVMVFIHGGGFVWGYGNMYRADYLINYDVILVTFNYRLNVFGFLNLDLPECPGNVGLKDQIMAFSWIRENIAAFGGDPRNITAFGESAGAACVHYLMLCPASRGLFDKAILQSGSAICPWAFTKNKTQYAFLLGKTLGCNTTDKRELLDFLMEVSAHDVVKAQATMLKEASKHEVIRLLFVPSIEERSGSDVLLPDDPKNLLTNTMKIPVITGINELEGLIMVFGKSLSDIAWINNNFNVLPNDIEPFSKRFPQIEQKVKEFYFGNNKPVCEETFPQLITLFTDTAFSNNLYDVTKPLLENGLQSPVFLYKFSYESHFNMVKQLVMAEHNFSDLEGPAHADELFYLFVVDFGINIFHEGEEKLVDLFCKGWTNFAKFGSPASSSLPWKSTSLHNPNYLSITDQPEMKEGLIDENRMKFWSSLRRELKLSNDSTSSKL
ncbi:hypothetical protein V9T40_006935 [Parthenolecanium corni]|uniref:Carboxylesterase type B domain-containing protein n=1 Tax=Parthenolecanium corni TaxID=536013 RepID=A0AAN9TUD3_9HEMI